MRKLSLPSADMAVVPMCHCLNAAGARTSSPSNSNRQRSSSGTRVGSILVGIVLALGALLPGSLRADEPKPLVREIYVPFADLNVLLENQPQRVLLSREEYEDLLKKAKKTPDSPPPQAAVLMSAEYAAKVEEDRARWTGNLAIDVLDDGIQAVPLDLSGVGIRSATLDNKPASIGRSPEGRLMLFVEGKGRHQLALDMVSPLEATAAQQVLAFRLPQPSAAKFRLTMPGDVEIKSGAAVASRIVDDKARETRFELVPGQGDTTLLMTLNSHLQRRQRAVVARSVLVDEVTAAYERLHATVSLGILQQAVDRFRFVVPEGFEITQVNSPLLSRWAIEKEAERRVLDVRLREQTIEPVVLNLSATRTKPALDKWSFPRLEPLDVVGQVAVVGLLVEERLDVKTVEPKGLVPIDTTVLAKAMPVTVTQAEPGRPPLRPVVSYYAPQAQFDLSARFTPPITEIDVQTNLLLTLGEREQRVRGGFLLTPRVDKLFGFRLAVPAGWHLTSLTGPDNKPLRFDRFGTADQVEVRLPQGAAPGQDYRVLFQAQSAPAGWLGDWTTTKAAFPVFAVVGATRDVGAVAIDAQDDMTVRPEKLAGLTPLDEREKEKYALGGVASALAYRYEGQPYEAALVVQRTRPRLTARTFSFARVESDALALHYEIAYTVEEARARQLVLSLPESTPVAIGIKPLDEAKIKEFGSRLEGGRRHWTVLLEEPRAGTVRLAVDFQQPLPAEKTGKVAVPLVRAEVVYQSGLVSIEGSAELHVEVDTPIRKVDVGELVDAAYQPGRRLLGVFGFVGEPAAVTLAVTRPEEHGLHPAIVEKAVLTTNLSAAGTSQTEAVFHLRTKLPYLEVVLPPGSELWSVIVDEKPVKPQTEKGKLLVSLPPAPVATLRALRIWYQTPVGTVGMTGTIDLPAPSLALRAGRDATGIEVPLADLQWNVRLPTGYQVVRSRGTVVARIEPPEPAALTAMKAVGAVAVWSPARAMHVTLPGQTLPSPYYMNDDAQYEATPGELKLSRHAAEKSAAPPAGMIASTEDKDEVAQDPFGGDIGAKESARRGAAKKRAKAGAARGEKSEGYFDHEEGLQREDQYRKEQGELTPKSEPAKSAPPRDLKPALRTQEPTFTSERAPERALEKPSPATAGVPTTPPLAPPTARSEPEATELSTDALTLQPPAAAPKKFKSRLEGLSSLKMSLVEAQTAGAEAITFQSLGADPRLVITVANRPRFNTLGWAIALAVAVFSVAITRRSPWFKTRWVLAVVVVATVVPLIPGLEALALPANMAVYAAVLSAAYFLLIGLLRLVIAALARLSARIRRRKEEAKTPAAAATTALVLAALLALPGIAQEAKPQAPAGTFILTPAEPPTPVQVPEDAVILPYDPESKTGIQDAAKMLVPYAKYVELWNRAHPDKKLEAKTPPAQFGLAGASYTTTLEGNEYLAVQGRLEIDVFVDQMVTVPLGLSGGVLARAELDGKSARLSIAQPVHDAQAAAQAQPAPNPPAQQPAQPMPQQAANPSSSPSAGWKPTPPGGPMVLVYVSGKGRHQLDLTVRLKLERRGGWRVVEGALPAAPASSLAITVPAAQTEVRLSQVPDRRTYDAAAAAQRIETALSKDGAIGIQWRPKVGEGQVDRSLTARSKAVLDVQEDGLRLYWQAAMEFRRGQRDAFRVFVPADYLVEKVEGSNVRGWEVRKEEGRQVLDLTLLKTAKDSEQFALRLWRAGAVGQGDLAAFEAPVVAVADAAMNQGQITVRRSPLLDLRTAARSGVSQAELSAQTPGGAVDESPLGIRPYEAYQFVTTPFSLKFTAAPVPGVISAETQMLVRISEHERQIEAQVKLDVRQRPVHRVEILLPEGMRLDQVTAPGDYQWVVSKDEKRPMVTVYLAAGRLGEFSIVLHGKLAREEKPGLVPLPKLEVRNVGRQEGDIAVQADPGYDVIPEDLKNIDPALRERVQRWMKPEQFAAVPPVAFQFRQPDYSGTLRLAARTPLVNCVTITNLRVTDRALEETVFLDFSIAQAGVRQVEFLLPSTMQDCRIRAPMLRQKTVEPVGKEPGSPVRVRLEFQDEVTGKLRVVVENDRLLTEGPHAAPVPKVETGTTNQQFIALESAGRDEVVPAATEGVERLSPTQSEAAALREVLGDKISQAYVVRGKQPVLSIKTQRREAQQFAGARIGLGETLLVIDSAGAYRGRQTYLVANATEQYLEIVLPEGAELWTAHVAGEPVKPAKVKVSGVEDPLRVQIPLVKTAAGDLDYPVVLKYGGRMDRLGVLSQVRFPLVRTEKINVERSNVQLYLPETHRWFDFGGTMGEPAVKADLAAAEVSYQTKLQQRLLETFRGGDDFAKARADNNLKQINPAAMLDSSGSMGVTDGTSNEQLRREMAANSSVQQEVQAERQKRQQAPEGAVEYDNRKRLNDAYEGQRLNRSKNVVQELGRNWDAAQERMPASQDQAGQFNSLWLSNSGLENPMGAKPGDKPQSSPVLQQKAGKGQGGGQFEGKFRGPGIGQDEPKSGKKESGDRAGGGEKGGGQQGDAQGRASSLPSSSSRSGEGRDQQQASQTEDRRNVVQRYQKRLEEQQQQQPAQMPGTSSFGVHSPQGGYSDTSNVRGGAGSMPGQPQAPTAGGMGGMGGMIANQPGGMPGMGMGPMPGGMPGPGAPVNAGGAQPKPQADMGAVAAPGPGVQMPPTTVNLPVFLASIDVDIPQRGQVFYFTTTARSSDLEVSGRAADRDVLGDIARAAVVILGVVIVLWIARAIRRGDFDWLARRRVSTVMLIAGAVLTLIGVFVSGLLLAGLVLLLGGTAIKLHGSTQTALE